MVYDAVFHPKTIRLAVGNSRFMNMIVKTAVEGIEQRFPEQRLSRDFRFPKMKFKARYDHA